MLKCLKIMFAKYYELRHVLKNCTSLKLARFAW